MPRWWAFLRDWDAWNGQGSLQVYTNFEMICAILLLFFAIIGIRPTSGSLIQGSDRDAFIQSNALEPSPPIHTNSMILVTLRPSKIHDSDKSMSSNPASILSKLLTVSDLQHGETGDGELVGVDENQVPDLPRPRETILRRTWRKRNGNNLRAKRFACWHSCLGPWKKRNPKTKPDPYKFLGTPAKVEKAEKESQSDHVGDQQKEEESNDGIEGAE